MKHVIKNRTPAVTLTELCGLDDAALAQYLQQKELFLQKLAEEASARIAAALVERKLAFVA